MVMNKSNKILCFVSNAVANRSTSLSAVELWLNSCSILKEMKIFLHFDRLPLDTCKIYYIVNVVTAGPLASK